METLSTTTGAVSVPIFSPNKSKGSLSQRFLRFSTPPMTMGLVLSAANVRGWTTGSGMEGPPSSDSDSGMEQVSTFPWSIFSKSPRRRMRVAFTCNVCGQRTTGAINPHAYTDGTVFVQCCGCNIFHNLVDNLNLFHEMKCYANSSFNPSPNDNITFKYFDLDEDTSDDIFPTYIKGDNFT
ncbi:hypothetical protein ACJIZ3_024758 [Penstemon smallii]|uniref:DNL-type domain-containing protein n=1 Tax=Penstemon smallii TaxID=265156 RepID=A0ABD3TST5_9LAMI